MGRCIVVTEQYQVTIQSQMGPRKGVLTLRYRGDRVTGSLEMVGYVNTVQGVRTEDGTIHLVHPIRTVISTIPCETDLELHGGCLRGTTTSRTARMRWEGALLRQVP